jgi:hypothetical protein
MLRTWWYCLLGVSVAASAGALAADLPSRSAPPDWPPSVDGGPGGHPGHRWRGPRVGAGGGVAWGLTPGVGQLGAAGFGYYAVDNCWGYEPVFDRFGNYFGRQPVYICVTPPID